MAQEIFRLGIDGTFASLDQTPYAAEEDLQILLARHPELLAGAQIDERDPRRWLLIDREQSLADRHGGAGRWSVDHLFVDQDAVPTIVEVKRSKNTQIRREIVGQMLDYAANGVRYWPAESLRRDLVERLSKQGATDPETEADNLVAELLSGGENDSTDPERFWRQVDDNLSAGRLRLLFVADKVPEELTSVIEFLNDQMARTEVLGIEIRQYQRDGERVFAPRLVGRTTDAVRVKGRAAALDLETLIEGASEPTLEVLRRLNQLAETHSWSTSESRKSVGFDDPGGRAKWATWYPSFDSVELYLGPLIEAGGTAEAEALRSGLESMVSRRLSPKHQNPSCTELLAAWDDFADKWIPQYIAARTKYELRA